MDTISADNWWDLNHGKYPIVNLLKHFSDQELQSELNRRQSERRKLEIMKIVGSREAIGFYVSVGGDERVTDWELHIVFSNGTKHRFDFSSRVGQTEGTMNDFRMLYFPHLTRLDHEDYERLRISKQKKKVCRNR